VNIRELLEKQAEKYSEKVFLYFEDQSITYQDFNLTVNRVANAFKRMDVRKGERVAIMLPNSPAFLYTWMGLSKIGVVEVPINIGFTEAEVKYILQHSEASGIVIHQECYPILGRIRREEIPKLRDVIFYGDETAPSGTIPFSALLNEKAELGEVALSEEDPAVCIYTSGTTDRPKGVINSHRNWVLTGEAYAFTVGITAEDRVMTSNPLFHANAQAYPTMSSLTSGASLILLKHFSASKLLEQARHYQASKVVLVQAVTPWVWDRPRREDDGDNPIKTLIAGNVPAAIYHEFEKRFQLKIQTIYSLTEAVCGIMGPREGTRPRKPGGIGVPMEHPDPSIKNEVKIIDQDGKEVPPGKQGEIVIRNPATMTGYFKDPERTAETKKNGWIYTGDIGYQDEEGYFFFVGRKKEVIRRRGELISPSEIESVLNSHPSVQESAVIGIPSGFGSGEEEVKAYVLLKPGQNTTPEDILLWCKGKLAEFKIPRFLEFRTEFPKSAIGRIQKNVLKTQNQDLRDNCYDRLKEEQRRGSNSKPRRLD
jgi:acyl-CoA synthetase (AMP-forming)/AMP-acid ligase II